MSVFPPGWPRPHQTGRLFALAAWRNVNHDAEAVLVAMAHTARFAIAHVSPLGEGGARLPWQSWGELVENVENPG
jgi:hypothetical protein